MRQMMTSKKGTLMESGSCLLPSEEVTSVCLRPSTYGIAIDARMYLSIIWDTSDREID